MTSTILLKRSLLTSIPGSLANGEFAYTANGDVGYIGSNGVIVAIVGKRVPGTLTANQALVTNSTNMIDKIMMGDATVNTIANSSAVSLANSTVTFTITKPTAAQQSAPYVLLGNGFWTSYSTSAPGGTNTQVQFNDSGILGGVAGFTFDKSTNNMTLANTFTVGGVSVINSTAIQVGANVVLSQTTLFAGNSTINTTHTQTGLNLANSTITSNLQIGALNIGANVAVGTTTIFVGNSTVNAVENSTSITFANSTINSVLGTGSVAVGANVSGNSTAWFVGNTTANAYFNLGTVALANSTLSSNLQLGQLNIGGNVFVSTSTVFVGNSTVNGTFNSTNLALANSTVSSNLQLGQLNVGANVFVSTTTIFVGNSTVNAVENSTGITFANSTLVSNLQLGALNIGANTTVNTTTIFQGNSTVNAFFNSLTFAIANSTVTSNVQTGAVNMGANVTLNTTKLFIGNTTVNTNIVQTGLTVANSTFTSSLNPQALSVQDIVCSGNLTVSGTLTQIDATNLTVADPFIKLARNNAGVLLDIGFYGAYNDGAARFTGFAWDASALVYELFANTTIEPTTTVDTAGVGYIRATLKSYLNTGAFISSPTVTNITANSTVSSAIIANTLTLTTALASSYGGTGLTTIAAGDVLVGNSTNGFTAVTFVANKVFQSNGTVMLLSDLDGGVF